MVPRLMCIVSGSDDLAKLPALAMAGVDAFQVRDKTLERDGLIALTNHVMNLVPAARVVVNDRVDVAVITGADGVHLGAGDLPLADARRIVDRARSRRYLSPRFVIGATCRTEADARAAAEAGADYAGVGPLFATTSKAGLPDPLGPAAVTAPARVLPVLGIGGVDADNVHAVLEAGAHGVAVIGGIWNAADPVKAARRFAEAVAASAGEGRA